MSITFANTETIGHLVQENDLYRHYHYPEMLVRYDSNFIAFKRMPTIQEFKEAEKVLRACHEENGQNHLKFTFPPNEKIRADLIVYLNQEGYSTGVNELYTIQPSDFPKGTTNHDIQVVPVNTANFQDYLDLQYEQEIQFGEEFAREKVKMHQANFQRENVVQVIGYYKNKPAGAVDVILTDGIAEIDGLFVQESLQRKGIGSTLQHYVMETFKDRTVILIADGEDTPREMYQRQHYQQVGFQWEVLKLF